MDAHSTTSRVAWTVAYTGLALFLAVTALEQFATAWATACGTEGEHHTEINHVALG